MWRPVALSAFLALLFVTVRSGEPPIKTDGEGAPKSDLGDEVLKSDQSTPPSNIDFARSSVHKKSGSAAERETDSADGNSDRPKDSEADEHKDRRKTQVAELSIHGKRTIPLPAPKTGDRVSEVRVVVTEGEQKTALASGEEEGLSLMPPGPDFTAKVQRELARLGCYRGRVDNIWGPMSRNAVARFNRMAKSKIPVKQPTRALLSSVRNAPDGFCAGAAVAGDAQPKVAALEPGASVEALKKRPSYLPPWMRGERMPEPDENRVTQQPEPEAKPEQPATRTAAREEPQATRSIASQAEREARRRARAQRQAQRRRSRSFSAVMEGRGAFWPGQ